MAVRMSVLSVGRPLPPRRSLVLISVRGWADPRTTVRLDWIIRWSDWESNPLPSGLLHSASISYATACPQNKERNTEELKIDDKPATRYIRYKSIWKDEYRNPILSVGNLRATTMVIDVLLHPKFFFYILFLKLPTSVSFILKKSFLKQN
jgi:hypothetical protein